MEFSSIYWLSEIHGKAEALLLSKYQILLADDDDGGSDGQQCKKWLYLRFSVAKVVSMSLDRSISELHSAHDASNTLITVCTSN